MIDKNISKYKDWFAIFLHPIAGRLIQMQAPPQSILLYSPKGEGITVVYRLQWRDMENQIAYYKIGTILKDLRQYPNR